MPARTQVDPTRTNIPPNETRTINFHGSKPNSRVVGLDKFHYVKVDAQTAANINAIYNSAQVPPVITRAPLQPTSTVYRNASAARFGITGNQVLTAITVQVRRRYRDRHGDRD